MLGGMALDTNPRDMFVEFDIAENKWKKLAHIPTPRYASSVFLIEDKLYVLGEVANVNAVLQNFTDSFFILI